MKNKLKQISLILFTMFCAQSLWAQIDVTGKVLDERTNEVIIGATIILKGTSKGTITDLNGAFKLNVPADAVLGVTYLGYTSQEVEVQGRTNLEILLKVDATEIDELVVVGYGVQRKSDLTGALSSVKMSDAIKSTPTSSISNAIQGRLSGVSIFSGSGQPGSGATIRIRGMNSLKADGGPLIVVDGLVGGSLESLNPADIASVEVLKDASATAVYGSRAANGVILVTTKSPEVGRVTTTYNAYLNLKTPYTLPKVMSPGEFSELANEFGKEFYTTPREFYTPDEVAAFYAGQGGYDYMNNVFRDVAIEHTHEISISGGSDMVKMLLSGSYSNNQGTVYESYGERANYRLKVDAKPKKWLEIGANFWGDWNRSQGPRFSQYNNLLIHTLTYPTTIEPINPETGEYNNKNLLGPQYNPMLFIERVNYDGYSYNSRLQGYVDVKLLKGLSFRMTHSLNFGNTNNFTVYGKGSYDYYQNYKETTAATARINTGYGWTNTNVLSYIREFNENHRINATLVFEQSLNKPSLVSATGSGGLLSEEVGAYNVEYAPLTTGASSVQRSTAMSYLGRINYVLMNRYMLTASWRRDGSSLLAKNYRWDEFPSVAVAWNIAEERFMEDLGVDQLKIRLGYGVTGNQAVPIYSQYTKIKPDKAGISQDRTAMGNEFLRWEKTSQYNLGLDLGFFNNRLTFNVDAYIKNTSDVLLDVTPSLYTGISSRLGNIGEISNKGVEVTIGADPYVTRDFNWNTTLIFGTNKGVVEKLTDGADYQDLGGKYENRYYRNIVGEKIATMWGYKCLGVWTTAEINELKASMSPEEFSKYNIEPGSYKYEDLDGVPGITQNDKQIIGNGQPTFTWSWNNTFNYKEFDFSFCISSN